MRMEGADPRIDGGRHGDLAARRHAPVDEGGPAIGPGGDLERWPSQVHAVGGAERAVPGHQEGERRHQSHAEEAPPEWPGGPGAER